MHIYYYNLQSLMYYLISLELIGKLILRTLSFIPPLSLCWHGGNIISLLSADKYYGIHCPLFQTQRSLCSFFSVLKHSSITDTFFEKNVSNNTLMRTRQYFVFREIIKMYIYFKFFSRVSYIKYNQHLEVFTKIQAIYNLVVLLIRSCLREKQFSLKIILIFEIMELNADSRDRQR